MDTDDDLREDETLSIAEAILRGEEREERISATGVAAVEFVRGFFWSGDAGDSLQWRDALIENERSLNLLWHLLGTLPITGSGMMVTPAEWFDHRTIAESLEIVFVPDKLDWDNLHDVVADLLTEYISILRPRFGEAFLHKFIDEWRKNKFRSMRPTVGDIMRMLEEKEE